MSQLTLRTGIMQRNGNIKMCATVISMWACMHVCSHARVPGTLLSWLWLVCFTSIIVLLLVVLLVLILVLVLVLLVVVVVVLLLLSLVVLSSFVLLLLLVLLVLVVSLPLFDYYYHYHYAGHLSVCEAVSSMVETSAANDTNNGYSDTPGY